MHPGSIPGELFLDVCFVLAFLFIYKWNLKNLKKLIYVFRRKRIVSNRFIKGDKLLLFGLIPLCHISSTTGRAERGGTAKFLVSLEHTWQVRLCGTIKLLLDNIFYLN